VETWGYSILELFLTNYCTFTVVELNNKAMARIDIDDPYTSFLESQVKAGLYNTISEAARDAIRKQMEVHEQRRLSSIALEIAKGEASIQEGREVPYSTGLLTEIADKGKAASLAGHPYRDEIKP